MDSSFAKSAPNRIEEPYGNVKNLRLRHPLAALGLMFGLSAAILRGEPGTAEWVFDLLTKLGHEDDAYHSTGLVLMEHGDGGAMADDGIEPAIEAIAEPGVDAEEDNAPVAVGDVGQTTGYEAEALGRSRLVDSHL